MREGPGERTDEDKCEPQRPVELHFVPGRDAANARTFSRQHPDKVREGEATVCVAQKCWKHGPADAEVVSERAEACQLCTGEGGWGSREGGRIKVINDTSANDGR